MFDYSKLLEFCVNKDQKQVIQAFMDDPTRSQQQIANLTVKSVNSINSIIKRLKDKAIKKNGGIVKDMDIAKQDIGEIAHLEKRLTHLQSENKKLRQSAADMTNIKSIIHGFNNLKEAEFEIPEWLDNHRTHSDSFGTPTIFLSDLHWGERVFRDQVQGVNEYDMVIAQNRLRVIIEKAEYLLFSKLNNPKFEGLVLALGGDMLSGVIHEELKETNSLTILEQLFDLYLNLIATIDRLEEMFGRIFVPCVTGNHARLDRKPRMKNAVKDNYEWLIYQFLAKHYEENPNVTVAVSDSFDIQYRLHGHTYLLTHGDRAFRGGTGITGPLLPWMRGTQKKQRVYEAINKPFDTLIMGHWHLLNFLLSYNIIVNGSLKGYDEFAMSMAFEFQEPAQAMWITSTKGNIWFTEALMPTWSESEHGRKWVELEG